MSASWIVSLQVHVDTPPIQVVPYFTFFGVPARQPRSIKPVFVEVR